MLFYIHALFWVSKPCNSIKLLPTIAQDSNQGNKKDNSGRTIERDYLMITKEMYQDIARINAGIVTGLKSNLSVD
ncbi:hypothetical protein ACHQM5_004984 [Ranunculus cassubicifolius]